MEAKERRLVEWSREEVGSPGACLEDTAAELRFSLRNSVNQLNGNSPELITPDREGAGNWPPQLSVARG